MEFRKSADNQPVNLQHIQANAVMPMGGGSPMFGGVSVETLKNVVGYYKIEADFSMQGTWYLNIAFGEGEKVKFSIDVLN